MPASVSDFAKKGIVPKQKQAITTSNVGIMELRSSNILLVESDIDPAADLPVKKVSKHMFFEWRSAIHIFRLPSMANPIANKPVPGISGVQDAQDVGFDFKHVLIFQFQLA